jgi:palmitoyltransferase ZDHHC9/14/18
LIFVTYPLIFGVSGWAFTVAILPGKKHPMLVLGWLVITLALIVALSLTGCRDPGIMYRHPRPPPQNENQWRWNDQAQTFRPRLAYYDSDTAVMVEEFDHTCPWTGTAIGKGNMFPFQCFVCLVFVCLVVVRAV